MKSPVALSLTLLLLASAAAASLIAPSPEGGARDGSGGHESAAGGPFDGTHHAARVERPAEGTTPTVQDAVTSLERRRSIVILSDADWNPANGVRSGTGTPRDPFLVSGYHVDEILFADTTRCYEITGNHVSRILVLDWTGSCGLVHHNRIENLRTNRNVERTGDPTAVVVTRNEIVRVEELRHFDGVLTENVIGAPPLPGADRLPGRGVALNVAGLNGADIARNTIHGGVDLKLHGHHHSGVDGASHHHGRSGGDRREDHTVRHVDFLFRDNVIVDDGFGLRYNDLDHAADDRTAASEREPALELPHVHVTTVRIVNNSVEGRGIRVSVLNAPDERHVAQHARLVVAHNTLREHAAGSAVLVQDVRDALVVLEGNRVERATLRLDASAGILMQRFENATVEVRGNDLPGFVYGIRAREFDASTTWRVDGNRAPDARFTVYWDGSVANPPEGSDGGREEHDHDAESALLVRGER